MEQNKDNQPLMVTIRCIAYNQERYIRDCLEGFVMQKTNFRFEAVVHDDASTDGTAVIIKEYAEKYPDIIKPILETENQYSKHDGSLQRIMDEACKGKYVAYCEGDDYWIDPQKIQKQVDFLEAHSDYSMCWTDAYQETNGKLTPYNRYNVNCQSPMEDIIEKGGAFIPTCSIVVSKSVMDSMPLEAKGFAVGDFPLQMWCGWAGKVWYIKEQTCVYRFMSQGSWTSKNSNQVSPEAFLRLYNNEHPIMEAFNKITEYKYNESFERYAAKVSYTHLLYAHAYHLMKPYLLLRKKYGLHTGRAEAMLIFGHPHLAKLLQMYYKLKGFFKKNNMTPIISIIVPCYNQAKYMREAFKSILDSTLQDWECVIVNDGSKDETLQIAQEYEQKDVRFHVVDISNGGLANARNVGIRHSCGKYILPLDSDDKIGEEYLELAVSYIEQHPETKLVNCLCQYFGDDNSIFTLPSYCYEALLWQNLFVASCVFRRADYDKTMGYNPNMKYGHEDWDFWLSLLKPEDKVYCIPKILFFYRKHGVSMISETQKKIVETNRQLILNHLDLYTPYIGNLISWHWELLHYKKSISELLCSRTYRLGYAILSPLKWLRNIIQKK